MSTSLRQQELIRGKVLSYLALIYPRAATLPLLQGELDIFGYPVSIEDLNFHSAYLVDKGYATLELIRGPHSHSKIPLLKITAKGIDYFDGRLPAEEGIYLEPRQ